MFIPREFQEHDQAVLHGIIEEVRLGTLLTSGLPGGDGTAAPIIGSHIPFMLDRTRGSNGTLIGHVDRRNPQWQILEQGAQALVTFLGPDSNVSAGWYGTSPRVPTWLYAAVHCYGHATMVQEADGLRRMVVKLSAMMEPDGSAWAPSQVDAYTERLLCGIVGFEIPIERIEGQVRMGQHNGADDRRRVQAALAAGTPRQQRMADAMQRLQPIIN